jgi:hypothetical protein
MHDHGDFFLMHPWLGQKEVRGMDDMRRLLIVSAKVSRHAGREIPALSQ